MDHQGRSLRVGAALILCALLLRLTGTGFFRPVAEFLAKPDMAAFLIYLETGRKVRFSPSSDPVESFSYESRVPDFARTVQVSPPPAAPTELPEPVTMVPVFAASDGEEVAFKNSSGLRYDAATLITQPLQWDLTAEEPAVLILHTHATESYTQEGEEYEETSAFRTLDEDYNMVSVGEHLRSLLEEGGIGAEHDRTLHDYPSYNGSYSNARKALNRHLKENPELLLVLDLHRDASGDNKNQMRTLAEVDGAEAAQIMFVVGTGSSGVQNPHWKENLSLALKLQVQMERIAPGICRNVNLRPQRFNQDLRAGTLLVEVGAAGNTHAEALRAVEVLAQAILDLAQGAETEEE